MEQGSQEWINFRRGFIGASDAPVILKKSPWKTPKELWKEKLGMTKIEASFNPYIQRGRDLEPEARKMACNILNLQLEPTLAFHATIPYLMASLDGQCGREAIEIKCPGKKDHNLALLDHIPKKYMPQLQHQIEVLCVDYIWYFSYYSLESYKLIKVYRNDEYILKLLNEEKKFWDCVQNLIEPEE